MYYREQHQSNFCASIQLQMQMFYRRWHSLCNHCNIGILRTSSKTDIFMAKNKVEIACIKWYSLFSSAILLARLFSYHLFFFFIVFCLLIKFFSFFFFFFFFFYYYHYLLLLPTTSTTTTTTTTTYYFFYYYFYILLLSLLFFSYNGYSLFIYCYLSLFFFSIIESYLIYNIKRSR